MLLLGTIEFGSIAFSYSAMQMGAATAARQVAVNLAPPAVAKMSGLQRVPEWARASVTASITQSNSADPAVNVIRVRMVSTTDQLAVMRLISRLVPWQVTAEVTVKQELPYAD